MSNFKDKLGQSQSSGGDGTPKINTVLTLEVKEGGVFSRYDKETKTNIASSEAISGIYIGSAMQMSAFSQSLGRDGGQFRSEYYVNKKHPMKVFAPMGEKYAVVCEGNAEDCEAFVKKEAGSCKKRQVIFLLTDMGLLAVVTNLTIAIDQLSPLKDAVKENMIVLTPKTLDNAEGDVSKGAIERMGKLIDRNPPNYASIKVGGPITDQIFDSYGGSAAVDEYVAWRKWREGAAAEPIVQSAQTNDATPNYHAAPSRLPSPVSAQDYDSPDDLPF
jgi:hypothetical protein